jgi:Fe-Mn family superoxide dismutase
MKMNRRQTLTALSIGGAAAMLSASSAGASMQEPAKPSGTPAREPFRPGTHPIAPLPFDAAKLKGISEKLIVSHHDNNYGGAVKSLNKVEAELAAINKDTPPFVVGGLKRSELQFTNSMVLHEIYFANLGGDGKPGGAIEKALADAHGSLARWEEEFRATGASLAGGSGWVLLCCNLHTGALRNYWSSNHTETPADAMPLLVMDMYEHAYQMEYGAAAAKYIDAFFQNVQWDEVNRRLERAMEVVKIERR